MRRFVVAFCLLFAPAALAQQAPHQPGGERLLMDPPDGWAPVVVQRGDKVNITRLFPPGQSDKQWTEMITLQIYPNSDRTPRAFLEEVIRYSQANCEATGPSAVTEAPNNGYPMAMVSVACSKGRASGMGGFVHVQSIRGKEALYVVQRHWRGPAFDKSAAPGFPPEMLREWGAFVKTVGLCDTRDSRHPCPR